tara:strand:- start:7795 stop:8289 length:495 start_codon:yes stop_codon:yes gene_type:complete
MIGLLVEKWSIHMLCAGGYKLGFYGNPPTLINMLRQTTMTCLLSTMARCTSGILAIAAFPLANQEFKSHVTTDHGWAYMVAVAPALYILLRTLVLDNAYVAPQIYRRVMHVPLANSPQSAFAVGNASSDDDVADKSNHTTNTDNVARDTDPTYSEKQIDSSNET